AALNSDRRQLFADFLDTLVVSERPTLSFLHILLPHVPYNYLPSGKTYETGSSLAGLLRNTWVGDETLVDQAYQRYLLQVGFVDTLVGQLINRLKAVGLYDRSLVVITADHGVSFRPKEFRRLLTPTNFQDILPVPLFIK